MTKCACLIFAIGLSISALPRAAVGQLSPRDGMRPSDQEVEELELDAGPARPSILPPVPPDRERRFAPSGAGDSEATTRIGSIRFDGNTAIDTATLEAIAAPWINRPLDAIDFETLRDALTLAYVDAGYGTSGAILPEQILENDGPLQVTLIEGELIRIDVQGTDRLRPNYVMSRMRAARTKPLHLPSLEARMQRLRRDPLIASLHAAVRPAPKRGESILEIRVEERKPYSVGVELHNRLSPSLGEVRGALTFEHRNVTGFGDRLVVSGDGSAGGGSIDATYEFPVSRFDTRVSLNGRYSRFAPSSGIAEELNIKSGFWGVELGVRQPYFLTNNLELGIGFSGSLRQSEVTFLESNDRFPTPGAEDRPARVAAFSLINEAIYRIPNQVMVLRSSARLGVKVFGSTRNSGPAPESQFISWLAQAQWVRRLDLLDIELVARADLQLANRRLLGLEQFAIGGRASVRGYRENQLVRDEGVHGGFEMRIPIWGSALGDRTFAQLAPFVDVGRGFSRHASGERAETLAAAGIGLRFALTRFGRGEIIWAQALRDVANDGRSLQDRSIHFRFVVAWP